MTTIKLEEGVIRDFSHNETLRKLSYETVMIGASGVSGAYLRASSLIISRMFKVPVVGCDVQQSVVWYFKSGHQLYVSPTRDPCVIIHQNKFPLTKKQRGVALSIVRRYLGYSQVVAEKPSAFYFMQYLFNAIRRGDFRLFCLYSVILSTLPKVSAEVSEQFPFGSRRVAFTAILCENFTPFHFLFFGCACLFIIDTYLLVLKTKNRFPCKYKVYINWGLSLVWCALFFCCFWFAATATPRHCLISTDFDFVKFRLLQIFSVIFLIYIVCSVLYLFPYNRHSLRLVCVCLALLPFYGHLVYELMLDKQEYGNVSFKVWTTLLRYFENALALGPNSFVLGLFLFILSHTWHHRLWCEKMIGLVQDLDIYLNSGRPGFKTVKLGEYSFVVPISTKEAAVYSSRATPAKTHASMVTITGDDNFVLGGGCCYGVGRILTAYHVVRGLSDIFVHWQSACTNRIERTLVKLIWFDEDRDIAVLSGPLIKTLSLFSPELGCSVCMYTDGTQKTTPLDSLSVKDTTPGVLKNIDAHTISTYDSDSGKPLLFGGFVVAVHIGRIVKGINKCLVLTPELIKDLRSLVDRTHEAGRGNDYSDTQMLDIVNQRGFSERDRHVYENDKGETLVLFQRQDNGAFIEFVVGSNAITYGTNDQVFENFSTLAEMDYNIGANYDPRGMTVKQREHVNRNVAKQRSAKKNAAAHGNKVQTRATRKGGRGSGFKAARNAAEEKERLDFDPEEAFANKPRKEEKYENKEEDTEDVEEKVVEEKKKIRNPEPDWVANAPVPSSDEDEDNFEEKIVSPPTAEDIARYMPHQPTRGTLRTFDAKFPELKEWSVNNTTDISEDVELQQMLVAIMALDGNSEVTKLESAKRVLNSLTTKTESPQTLQHLDHAPPPFLGSNFERHKLDSDPVVEGFTYHGPTNKRFYAPVEPMVRLDIVVADSKLMDECAIDFPLSKCAPYVEQLNMERFAKAIKPSGFNYKPWQSIWEDYLKIAFRTVNHTRVLTFDESLATFTSDKLLDKSAGYPFNEKCPCGQSHKYKGGVIECPPAVEYLRKCFDDVSKGINPDFPMVLDTFCKDERQKKVKVDDDKTRLVNTNTMLSELVLRAEFHVGIKNMSSESETIPIKIGMNIHDGGLHRMYDRVSRSNCTIEADADNMDSTEDGDLLDFSFRSFETVMGPAPDEASRNRRDFGRQSISGLKTFNVNGKLLRQVVAFYNSSGHFLTGDINSFAMLFNIFQIYFDGMFPTLKKMLHFVTNTFINIYGDDVLVGFDVVKTVEQVENGSNRLGLRTPASKQKISVRTLDSRLFPCDTNMVSGSSFLGQIGCFANGHWVFKPSRPEKVLVNFARPMGSITLHGVGEQNVVLSLLANFCYDDEVDIVVKDQKLSVFDSVYKQYSDKYKTIVLPSRRIFKSARSGEESGQVRCEFGRRTHCEYDFDDLSPFEVREDLILAEESGKKPVDFLPVASASVVLGTTPVVSPPGSVLTVSKLTSQDKKDIKKNFSKVTQDALDSIQKLPRGERQEFMRKYIAKLKSNQTRQEPSLKKSWKKGESRLKS